MAKQIRPGVWAVHFERELEAKKRETPMCDTPGPVSGRPGHGTQRKAVWRLQRHDGAILACTCDECRDEIAALYERGAAA